MTHPQPAAKNAGAVQTLLLRLPDTLAAVLLFVITVLITAQVLVRYAFGGSLVWSEELTRLLFVWMVLVAAVTAPRMQVDFLVDLLPPRLRALQRILVEFVVMGLTIILIQGAWGMMDLRQFDIYIALGISVSWVYLSLFLAGFAWLLRSLATVVAQWRVLSDPT
ncbi:MAG: TRAP transporter small permease [Betaproteobacteria bacterium]|jgi:TRAP-type C4-dicarboxylate transport system permease small subunit|nr:TRAP transporter small permease [Burkholderiales bacterium]NBX91020.1 TRAP transporter small permease [Betaproteobacteria bacterium]